ncbi:unnamed protein product [Urochloa humidicola]
MSTVGAAPRKNGSRPLALDPAAMARRRTLGRGVWASAATAAGLSFGRGGGSTAPGCSLSRGVGLAPPSRSRGHGGEPVATRTTVEGGFSSSSVGMEGFPFPHAPSPPLFDVAGIDPPSPRSWDLSGELDA